MAEIIAPGAEAEASEKSATRDACAGTTLAAARGHGGGGKSSASRQRQCRDQWRANHRRQAEPYAVRWRKADRQSGGKAAERGISSSASKRR